MLENVVYLVHEPQKPSPKSESLSKTTETEEKEVHLSFNPLLHVSMAASAAENLAGTVVEEKRN